MVKIYVRKILDKTSKFTIDMVPERWKEQVKALLKQQSSN